MLHPQHSTIFQGAQPGHWYPVECIGPLHSKGCRAAFPACSPPASIAISELAVRLFYFLIISRTALPTLSQRIQNTLSSSFYESSKTPVSKHDKKNVRKGYSGEFYLNRCKTPKQNSSNSNSAIHIKNHISWPNCVYSRNSRLFYKINSSKKKHL